MQLEHRLVNQDFVFPKNSVKHSIMIADEDTRTLCTIQSVHDFQHVVLQKFVIKQKISHSSPPLDSQECIICSSRAKLNVLLVRRCLCSHSPCAQHTCSCATTLQVAMDHQPPPATLVGHPCCFPCLLQHLWASSSSSMRKFGRFRAKCPTCKAEYCAHDFVIIEDSEKQQHTSKLYRKKGAKNSK